MEINKEEIFGECSRILASITDLEELETLIINRLKELTFNEKHLWIKIFEELLRSQIYDIAMISIPILWESRINDMKTLIPVRFLEIPKEICATLDEETAFLFRYFWIERLIFCATIAYLKS